MGSAVDTGAGSGAGAGKEVDKGFRAGTHRLVPPGETLRRVRPMMSAMGITRIANITGLDDIGIPVVMVCRPNARSLAVSQGKGLDLAAAKASGLMESVEGYHAEHITLPLKLASLHDFRARHPVVDVHGLPQLSVSQFHPNLPLLWIAGHDLLHDTPRWLPYEMVHTNYTLPLPTGSGSFMMSTNGLASGNHWLEAVIHGICEVIERDATSLWQLSHDRDAYRLDLDTVDDPDCREVLERYRRAGVAVAVWNTTTDIGVPSFHCSIANHDPALSRELARQLYPVSGAGTHPNRGIALLRALTEAAQTRLTLISGARDDTSIYDYRAGQDVDSHERVLSWMLSTAAVERFEDIATFDSDSFEKDLAWLLERLRAAGIGQVVAVDLTKPEFRIPVARIVIPGLEGIHYAPGYVPGARARQKVAPGARGAL